jgi:polysaccharide pyruvyl transferase WcaK-like protein
LIHVYTWGGFNNFGDDWISEVGRKLLHEFNPKFHNRLETKSPFHRFRSYRSDYVNDFHSDSGFSPLIVWGGGIFPFDISSSNIEKFSKIFSKSERKIYAFGIGVGEIPIENREMAHNFYSRFEQPVYVRSQQDLDALLGIGIEAILSCDVVLLDPNLSEYIQMGRNNSGFSSIILPKLKKISTDNNYRENYFGEVMDVIRDNKTKSSIFFLNYVQAGHSVRHGSDSKFWKNEFPQTISAPSLDVFKGLVADSEVFVSGRLHTSIFRLLTGREVYSIAYQSKFALINEFSRTITNEPEKISSSSLILCPESLDKVIERGKIALVALKKDLSSNAN